MAAAKRRTVMNSGVDPAKPRKRLTLGGGQAMFAQYVIFLCWRRGCCSSRSRGTPCTSSGRSRNRRRRSRRRPRRSATRWPGPAWCEPVHEASGTCAISVGSQLAGVVTKVGVSIGQEVKAGDLLFELDPRQTEADLKVREANVTGERSAG